MHDLGGSCWCFIIFMFLFSVLFQRFRAGSDQGFRVTRISLQEDVGPKIAGRFRPVLEKVAKRIAQWLSTWGSIEDLLSCVVFLVVCFHEAEEQCEWPKKYCWANFSDAVDKMDQWLSSFWWKNRRVVHQYLWNSISVSVVQNLSPSPLWLLLGTACPHFTSESWEEKGIKW